MTFEEMKNLPKDKKEKLIDHITAVRKKAKVVTYAGIYGVGKQKLARETGMKVKDAGDLLEAYWKRNWAVKKVAEKSKTKVVGGQTWIYNPVSGFWYSLRFDRDRWSTLNQGTGVYIFDSWLARCSLLGYMGNASFHDETLGFTKDRQQTSAILQKGIGKLNEDLDLNVTMSIDVQYGENYADVH